MPFCETTCITLSGAHDDRHNPDKTTPHFPVCRTAMLDDRTACRSIALFDPISSSFFGSNRLLQQFHSQWGVVYPAFNTPLCKRRPVVPRRYRFFEDWQPDRHPHPSGSAQSFRHDSRTAWRKIAMPVSFRISSVMPTGQTSAAEDGAIARLSGYRSRNCGYPARQQVLPAVQLPAEIAVLILAEFIRNPQSGFTELSKTIARRTHIRVDVAMVQRLFEQHGLKKMTQTVAPRLGRH